MLVAVGSLNPVKVGAAQKAFLDRAKVVAVAADSKVGDQPNSDDETRLGSINRAKDALAKLNADLGIGLEGGTLYRDGSLYLCNWAALYSKEGETFVISGPTLLLPKEFEKPLREGLELNQIAENFLGIKKLGSKGGLVGLFTKEAVTREAVFLQMLQILVGQYFYYREAPALFSLTCR